MAFFPLFIELKDKPCLVVGAGQVAARKIEALLEFEGDITAVAPSICDDILKLSEHIHIERQDYNESFLQNKVLVIAATNDNEVNQAIYQDCVQRNIPVNVVDNINCCTFFFPAYVRKGPLTIGITSSGKGPLISSRLRKWLEQEIPDDIEQQLDAMSQFREQLKKEQYTQAQRKEILEQWLDNGGER